MSDSDTSPFLAILQNFQEHLFYWTPPVVAFSNFKAPGFTEAVIQMNFWITHGLAHLNTLSYSLHFYVYFRQAQAFCCILTASLTSDILYFLTKKDRNKLTLGSANFFLRKPLSNNQYPAKFGIHSPYESGDITSLSCHVTKGWMCHVTLWVGFPHPKSTTT